jgi:hypothetical protein
MHINSMVIVFVDLLLPLRLFISGIPSIKPCCMWQVAVLSEGNQLYFGDPGKAIAWFQDQLGYQYIAERDGAPSDWLIDLVAVGFTKPKEFAER